LSYTNNQIEYLVVKMDTPAKAGEQPGPDVKTDLALGLLEERRKRRLAALKAAEGLWKHRTDIPQDGAQYQDQLRAEWP